jgi:hypothetical protein
MSQKCSSCFGYTIIEEREHTGAGVILNDLEGKPDASTKTNPDILARYLDVPLLGVYPHRPQTGLVDRDALPGSLKSTSIWRPSSAEAPTVALDLPSQPGKRRIPRIGHREFYRDFLFAARLNLRIPRVDASPVLIGFVGRRRRDLQVFYLDAVRFRDRDRIHDSDPQDEYRLHANVAA